jgi:hypothetical protein
VLAGVEENTRYQVQVCSFLNRLLKLDLSDFSNGELQNESRNDFDYRPGCVLAWWRRLVLGARARLNATSSETEIAVLEWDLACKWQIRH